MKNEKRGGAYRELEQEIIKASIHRFLANTKQDPEEDPRIAATLAETNAQGFLMEEGRYADIPR